MRLMLGLDHGEGITRFDGQRYRDIAQPMRRVGVLLEAKAFHPTRTARNHLRMLAAANQIPDKSSRRGARVGRARHGRAEEAEVVFAWEWGNASGSRQRCSASPTSCCSTNPRTGSIPQGINWLRDFLKAYAARGRTVLASSHLLAEMELMADHLIVIGRGRLLADTPIADFVARSSHTSIVVRSPEAARLAELLVARGATVIARG